MGDIPQLSLQFTSNRHTAVPHGALHDLVKVHVYQSTGRQHGCDQLGNLPGHSVRSILDYNTSF